MRYGSTVRASMFCGGLIRGGGGARVFKIWLSWQSSFARVVVGNACRLGDRRGGGTFAFGSRFSWKQLFRRVVVNNRGGLGVRFRLRCRRFRLWLWLAL